MDTFKFGDPFLPTSISNVWNDDNFVEMVKADNRPFEACNNTIDAQLYNKNVGILELIGFDYSGKPTRVEMAGEQPCFIGEDITDQEIGKEWSDDNIIKPQMPNIVEEPVSDE